MSMTSCNLLLASFGASSSSMRFHPLGKVKWYDSASLYCVCERMIRPERDPLSLLCHGLDSHQRPSHLCLSRFDRHEFAFCIFGHKQTSTHITHDRLARCRALCSGFPAPMTSVHRVAVGCIASTTVLHAAVSIPNVICLRLLSDLTPTACPTDSML